MHFFFFWLLLKEEEKKTVGAVVQIRCTATPLMSLTPLNRSLHICLFRFVDFYLFSPVIYLKQHLSRGVQAGKQLCAAYLCHQRWHSPTTSLRSPFKSSAILKGTFALKPMRPFWVAVSVKRLTFWERCVNWQRLHVCEDICHCRCLCLCKTETDT